MPIQHSALIPESPTLNANTRIRSLTEPSTKTVAKSFSCTRSMARHSVMTFCFFWYVFAFLHPGHIHSSAGRLHNTFLADSFDTS